MLLGELPNGIHMGGVTVEMHGKNSFRARSACPFDASHVNGMRKWIHIHQDRCRPGVGNGQSRGDKTVGSGNDLVAGPDVIRPENQLQCRSAGIYADRVSSFTESSKFLLEKAHLPPEDEVCFLDYSGGGLIDLVSDSAVLGGEINEGNLRRLICWHRHLRRHDHLCFLPPLAVPCIRWIDSRLRELAQLPGPRL